MSNFINELQNYQNVPRSLVFDGELSDRARFVYVFMACKPDGWDFFLEPMASEIGYSVDTLRKYINELVASGWLVKGEQQKEKGMFGAVQYTLKATKTSDTEKTRHGENISLINIDIEEKRDYKEEESIKRNPKSRKNHYAEDFERAWELALRKGSKTEAYKYWQRLKEADKAKVLAHLPFYYRSNDRQYLKDFSGYLHRCYYSSVVCDKQGNILYDPERQFSNTYRPSCGGMLNFNSYYGCYIYMGEWRGSIADGYTDDNRPNGARIMLNNARGTVEWNAAARRWENIG